MLPWLRPPRLAWVGLAGAALDADLGPELDPGHDLRRQHVDDQVAELVEPVADQRARAVDLQAVVEPALVPEALGRDHDQAMPEVADGRRVVVAKALLDQIGDAARGRPIHAHAATSAQTWRDSNRAGP